MPTMQPGVRKVVITCAVTGNAPFNPRHPAFPITPKDIAAACIEAARAGAAVVHVHVRDPNTGAGSRNPELFKETVDRLRDSGVDVILNLTAGLGGFLLPDPADERRALPESDVISAEERMAHLELCRPDIASLDITTGNQVEGAVEFVYFNTTRTLRAMARRFQELNIKPELETFSAGDVEFGKSLIAEGLISGVPLFQFVLGVKWGAPADSRTLLYMLSAAMAGSLGSARARTAANARGRSMHSARRQCSRRTRRQSLLEPRRLRHQWSVGRTRQIDH